MVLKLFTNELSIHGGDEPFKWAFRQPTPVNDNDREIYLIGERQDNIKGGQTFTHLDRLWEIKIATNVRGIGSIPDYLRVRAIIKEKSDDT